MFWMGRRKPEQPEADLVVQVQPAPLANRERLAPYVEGARVKVDTARERVTPYVEGARGRVDTARERVTPYVEHALDEAATKFASVLASAGPVREEVQRRGSAAAAALKGEVNQPAPESRRWGRRFVFLSLLTGLGAAAFAFFKRRQDDDSWITADTSYPTYGGSGSGSGSGSAGTAGASGSDSTDMGGTASTYAGGTSTSAATTGAVDGAIGGLGDDQLGASGPEVIGQATVETADAGGAGPDEAAADATDEPTDPSTPDEPAERVTPKDVADKLNLHNDY